MGTEDWAAGREAPVSGSPVGPALGQVGKERLPEPWGCDA